MKMQANGSRIEVRDLDQELRFYSKNNLPISFEDKGNGVFNITYDCRTYSLYDGGVKLLKQIQDVPTFWEQLRISIVKLIMPKDMYI